jgi:pyruvate dehydrogenase E2 component (dihydrolipoyllysine-residue acetyltransferase)
MPSVITMPAFSSTMESGKLVQWLVNEGDKVKTGQPIAEVETDKAIAEIEATTDGCLGKILVNDPDMEIAINATIGIILLEGESEDDLPGDDDNKRPETTDVESKESSNSETKNSSEEPVQTSPGARRVAKEAGLDISLVKGTGPKGRITKNDVLEHIANNTADSKNEDITEPSDNNSISSAQPEKDIIAISPMRNAIAKRLVESKRNIPHFYLEINITLDKLLEMKTSLLKTGTLPKLSLNVFFIKAAALAMKDVPRINTSWVDDKIIQKNDYNVGMAVAIDDGLIVPVICDANKKELATVDLEAKELIKLSQNGRLPQSKMRNASLTISNLGMYKIEKFSAIINPPESCILALGTTLKKPVVVEDNIVIRNVMTCTMSADHRLIDGAVAAQFLNKFKTILEHPMSLLV